MTMSTQTQGLEIAHHTGIDLPSAMPELIRLYAEIYADQLSDPFFSVDRYRERLESLASRGDGSAFVMGYLDGDLIGYALGNRTMPNSKRWAGLLTAVDPELLVEDGSRTFVINEIMVVERARRHGYAQALHTALLVGRSERRATLLVLPDNEPAKAAYRAWGYRKIGDLHPFSDAPIYESMILDSMP
jgi:GNAT superfamily N-acetyltransferase